MPTQPYTVPFGTPAFDSALATAHYTGDKRLEPGFDTSKLHPTAHCHWCMQEQEAKGIPKDKRVEVPLMSIRNGQNWRCPLERHFERQRLYAVRTGVGSSVKIHYLPLPIQVDFIEAVLQQKHPYILLGGAAGGSKSHGLRWLAHYLCLLKPGFKVLLLRRTFGQLLESHINRAIGEVIPFKARYLKDEKAVDYSNGSRLKFGHCEHLGDEQQYQGDEYDLVLFDEMTHFHESMITFIASRLRTSRKGHYGDDWMPIVAGGTNPGNVGADYCLSHFIEKEVDRDKYEYYDPTEYKFIPSLLTNNPYIDKFYIRKLQNLPKAKREALIRGDWYSFEGMFFDEFLKRDELQDDGSVLKSHIAEIEYGTEFERFCSLDWGFSDKFVCLWWVCLSDGRFFIEDEYVINRTHIPELCAEIKRRNKKRGIKVRYTAASPDLFPETGQSKGESRAETFRKNGVPLRPAKNKRIPGWQRCREILRHDEEGYPTVRMHPRCTNLVRSLPQMVSDVKDPEDVAQHKEDHAPEAFRYGAMSRPRPTRIPVTSRVLKGTGGELLHNILKKLDPWAA